MISPAITWDDWDNVPVTDSGVSDEAVRLRKLLHRKDDSSSAAIKHNQALASLYGAYEDAHEDGWDGEGAASANPDSFAHALKLLALLPSWVPNPDIYVDPDGEMCFEWDSGRRSVFSISIGRDGTLTYAGLFGSAKQHGVEPFIDEIPGNLLENISRSFNGSRRSSTE